MVNFDDYACFNQKKLFEKNKQQMFIKLAYMFSLDYQFVFFLFY